MNTLDQLRAHKAEIQKLAHLHGAANVRIFGSVSRHEDHPGSDIDFLVDMEDSRSLLDLIGFQQDMESMLRRPADVLTMGSINPDLRERILAEAVPL